MYTIDRNQGDTQTGHSFGYVVIGDGGLFFTWRYDPAADLREQVNQVVATMEEDEIDPPTGRWSMAVAERSLRSHIAEYGLVQLPG